MDAITIQDVRRAAERIKPYVHHTPVLTCAGLDVLVGARIFMKCENFQKVGAFKARGACNAVFSLSDEAARRGVVTHSSGNHAQAVAYAARLRQIPAYVVMPSNALAVKKAAVENYGGLVTTCEPTQQAREETAAKIKRETGAAFIHPYDNPYVIAGQGTAAMELIEEVPDLDMVIAPVGGGGLLSGTCIAVRSASPAAVLGAEPEAADDAYRSLQAGKILPSIHPQTIADGLLTSLGELTFPIIRSLVSEIITASEAAIIQSMRLLWERAKIVVEPSGALPIAVLLEQRMDFSDLRVGVILSGGNVDLDHLPRRVNRDALQAGT
jgi:threonine dehydratase